MKIKFLKTKDAIELHQDLVAEFSGLSGIRDKKLLESAMHQPQVKLFGKFAYKDIFEMAASYCFHIIKNHPFIDGNKRTGILVTLTFLEKNGYKIRPNTDLYTLALDTASSKLSKEQIAQFFKKHSISG